MKDIRMMGQLTGGIFKFYHALLLLISILAFSLLIYFWKIGFLDGSRAKDLHQASYIVQSITAKSMTNDLSQLIKEENPKKAIKSMDFFLKELGKVDQATNIDGYNKFSKSAAKIKKDIYSLISYPKTSKVLSVFNTKMNKFYEFIVENKWRTLARMSKRIFSFTKSSSVSENLGKIVKTVEKDFESMIKITKSSVLTRAEKSEVLSRISNLRVEMSMLKNFINDQGRVLTNLSSFKDNSTTWFENMMPELSLKKMELEKIGKYYIFGILGILSCSIMMLFGGLFFEKRTLVSKQAELQSEMESFVSEALLEKNDEILESYTGSFQNYSLQMRDYIGKRMSYGSIFQEAIPLGSILLDKNLKVIWANKHFLQEWELVEDDVTKGYISWDYLSKLTNLGEDDPVVEALKFQVAGIYQVQVKVSETSESWPYEMFVSPVKYQGEKRVMLFFYSLMSLQQTISDQSRGIVSPVEKTIDAMIKDEYGQEKQSILANEYEIGDIRHIHEKFATFHTQNQNLIKSLEVGVQKAENNLLSKDDKLEDMKNQVVRISEILNRQKSDFISTKDQIIAQTGLVDSFSEFAKTSLNELGQTMDLCQGEMKKVEALLGNVNGVTKAIPNYEVVSGEFKRLKRQGSELRANLQHSFHQFIHLKKKIENPEILSKVSNWFDTFSRDYKNLETHSMEFEKKLTSHEVTLSKSTMLFNDLHKKSMELTNGNGQFEKLQNSKTAYRQLTSDLRNLEIQVNENQELMVAQIQKLFLEFKSQQQSNVAMQEVLGQNSFSSSTPVNTDQSQSLIN